MKKFGRLDQIEINRPETYEGRIFLTFDLDWVHDEILLDTINLVETAGVAASWFVTHDSPVISTLRTNAEFELGVHPNFNSLLSDPLAESRSAATIIDEIKTIVPEATSVRSHSVTQGGLLLKLFAERGLVRDSNDSIPYESGIAVKPFTTAYGIMKLPFFWADEHEWVLGRNTKFENILQQVNLAIFAFHPIHVFLNTESAWRYESTRHLHRKPDQLILRRHAGQGAREQLLELLSFGNKHIQP